MLRQCRELFEGLESLTDCGGGDGTTARSIVEAYPHIKCTVLDLPKVMDKVPPTEGAVKYVSGDLFHVVPPAQAVLLKVYMNVAHSIIFIPSELLKRPEMINFQF